MSAQDVSPIWLDDCHLDGQWLRLKLGIDDNGTGKIESKCLVQDISNTNRRGESPRYGATLLVTLQTGVEQEASKQENEKDTATGTTVVPHRIVLKQVAGPSGFSLSQQLGLAREALFYRHLAPLIQQQLSTEKIDSIIPQIYYSHGDMISGSKYILMQDLPAPHWVDSGIFFGPGNPNNWTRDLPKLIQECCGGDYDPISAEVVAEQTFQAMAIVHATFWQRSSILLDGDENYNWLRGQEWLQGQGRESWEASQGFVRQIWSQYCAKEEKDPTSANGLQWDPIVRAAVEKAVQGISWEKQLERLNRETHWTLVHGDFWPGNVLYSTTVGDAAGREIQDLGVRLVDWEMVGLGSGPQDLGQYILSNMDPILRRSCERHLIEVYYEELCAAGVNNRTNDNDNYHPKVTFDYCWQEYKIGGVERWLWFLVYFLGQDSTIEWARFFHGQIAAFMKDHNLTEADITQPRP